MADEQDWTSSLRPQLWRRRRKHEGAKYVPVKELSENDNEKWCAACRAFNRFYRRYYVYKEAFWRATHCNECQGTISEEALE